MNRFVFVVAGRYNEFLEHVSRYGNSTRGFRNVVSVESIRGTRCESFIRMGTWNQRPDIEDVMIQLHISGATELVTNTANTLHNVWIDEGPAWIDEEPELRTEDDKYFYRIGYSNGKDKRM